MTTLSTSLSPSPEKAKAKELLAILLQRRAIRKSLTEWSRHCGFEPAKHHSLIISELEALERGEIDRLAVSAPPGSAKTTYVSHLFSSWYLARNPSHLILSGSHTQAFAERKIGRRVRELVEKNAAMLGLEIAADTTAMADWALSTGGGFRAVGVGVAVAGERADLGLVEDPFARWEDAQNAVVQETAYEWFTGDFVPRLKPNAKRVIIMTRFNEFDLLGRVFERDAALGIKWRVIRLPMIAEEDDPVGRQPGERLWPEWFTEEQVIEARSDAQKWSALYQQSPSPISGEYFRAEWLKPYTAAPDLETMRVYGGSDYATTSDGGDYSCHVLIGVSPEDDLYLIDIWRARTSTDIWVDALCDLVLKYKPMGWAEEKGQITAGIGPFLDRRARERKAYFVRTQFPTRADKATRARSMQGMMALQGLHVPVHAKWYPDFRAELLAFPQGKHDDQVDAIGLIGQLLDTVISGKKRATPVKQFDIERDAYQTLPAAQIGAYAMGGSAANLSWGENELEDFNWRTM